jgi:hypothetical protein
MRPAAGWCAPAPIGQAQGSSEGGGRVRALRVVVPVLTALVAVVALAPAAAAAPGVTAGIGGFEYAATRTEGRFGGAADGQVPGAWLATVVHDPLDSAGGAVPITGGSFTLRNSQQQVSGRFVRGTVAPLGSSDPCGNERFDVNGTLALDGGGRGSFAVVLTHLRVPSRSGCRTYGAVVAGSLTVPSRMISV